MKTEIIFLDVDEVLANWLAGAVCAWGLDFADLVDEWASLTPRPWDVFDVVPLTTSQGWQLIHARGADFWADLDPYPWWRELYSACVDIAPTYLLTSPSLDPSCAHGKTQWIQRHFGSSFRDYLIGGCKHACARPGALLIDDSPSNCKKFKAYGGEALLFPGIGNELHALRHDPLPHVFKELK